MMRFQFAIQAGLGALLVMPALTLGVQHNESLESALRRTVTSLEELGRIEQRLQQRDPSAIADILAATEQPLETSSGEGGARDAALLDLRGVVGRLQRDLDELENKADPKALEQVTRRTPVATEQETRNAARPELTVGLDDALRRRLGERVRPIATEPSRSSPTTSDAQRRAESKTAFESDAYAADSLRLGRALYRQGEFAQALDALSAGTDGDSLYWRARCLEKLGRDAEAITVYNQAIALPGAGYSAQRAKEDLEFLEWRLTFERTRAANKAGASEVKQP